MDLGDLDLGLGELRLGVVGVGRRELEVGLGIGFGLTVLTVIVGLGGIDFICELATELAGDGTLFRGAEGIVLCSLLSSLLIFLLGFGIRLACKG